MLVTVMKIFILEQYGLDTIRGEFSKKVVNELNHKEKNYIFPDEQECAKRVWAKIFIVRHKETGCEPALCDMHYAVSPFHTELLSV